MEFWDANSPWTSQHAAWLDRTLQELNWSYTDLDEAFGYHHSRGSYSRQVCECKRKPSKAYRRRLARWWARQPQPQPEPDFLLQIQTVAAPWLRERQGDRVGGSFTRRRAQVARKRMARHR